MRKVLELNGKTEILSIPNISMKPKNNLNSNHREVNRQYYPTEQLRQSNAIKKNDSTHKA